jgi:hypothetical protein
MLSVMCGPERSRPTGSWIGWKMTTEGIMVGLPWCSRFPLSWFPLFRKLWTTSLWQKLRFVIIKPFMSDLLSCTTRLDEPRVLYVCCTASRELRGLLEWSIPRIPSSRMVVSCVSPRVSYVSIPRVEYARQGYTPFKRRVSEVGRCPCSGLTHEYRFYSER